MPLPYVALIVLVGLAIAMYAVAAYLPIAEPVSAKAERKKPSPEALAVSIVAMTTFSQELEFKLPDDTDIAALQFDRVAKVTSVTNGQMTSFAASLMVVAAVASVGPTGANPSATSTSKSFPPASR